MKIDLSIFRVIVLKGQVFQTLEQTCDECPAFPTVRLTNGSHLLSTLMSFIDHERVEIIYWDWDPN